MNQAKLTKLETIGTKLVNIIIINIPATGIAFKSWLKIFFCLEEKVKN